MEGDTIVELDGRDVRNVPHTQLVDMLRDCPIGHRGRLVVRRSSPKHRFPFNFFPFQVAPRLIPALLHKKKTKFQIPHSDSGFPLRRIASHPGEYSNRAPIQDPGSGTTTTIDGNVWRDSGQTDNAKSELFPSVNKCTNR